MSQAGSSEGGATTGADARPGRPARRGVPSWLLAGGAGVAALALGLGVGELVAALIAPRSSPILVVGALLIDLAPSWAKETAIALFGTGDKAALITGIAIMLVVVAAAAGVLERRRPPIGSILIGLAGIFGIIAAGTREASGPADALPPVVVGFVAVLALRMLLRRLEGADGAAGEVDGLSRRGFLAWSGGAVVVGALAAVAGTAMQAGSRAATAARDLFKLPTAAVAAPPIPAGAELDIPGLSPIVTPTEAFYRIDTALQVPIVSPSDWTLHIHGLVDEEIDLSWDELIALPLKESVTTLMCVSNEVGGGLIGNAVWLGYPIRELLERAKPQSGADMVLSRSADGWTAGTPLEALQEVDRNAILAIGMNGEPLTAEHGFPVRMVVPGLYGYVSATKWVVDLEVTRFADASAYWTDRGWGERGPVKIQSRIDVPGGTADAGTVTIAGVAWHQHTGIAGVEVQVDDGPWREADLGDAISIDTWRQWRLDWDADPGAHRLRVRAIGEDGEVQTGEEQGVLPDGATGYHTVSIDVV